MDWNKPVKRLGVFVGEQGNWSFFQDIFDYLSDRYDTSVYKSRQYRLPLLHGRVNRWAHFHGIRTLLSTSDVAFFEWASELLEPASKMPKTCPIVARLHSYELYAWGQRINWHNVDRIVLVSEAMRSRFCEEFPDHAAKTTVVWNAVRLDKFHPAHRPPGSLDLGMLCSFYPRKRIYEIILMFAGLSRLLPEAVLHLGGGRVHGPDNDEYYVACRRLVRNLGLEGSVRFYERVTEPEAWLRNLDIFISNSYWEGQQVALLEALASGCYCLSHCWSGAEEILPAENLYGVDDELLRLICAFAALSPAEKDERRRAMRRIACSKFDFRSQRSAIHQLLEQAITQERRSLVNAAD
jgi:glycosyltransferase involved in cell wall biosynthesis